MTARPVNAAQPLVSAIIATHNHGQHISRALDSLFAQEGLGEEFQLEIIVVDDASTDGTSEVVRQFPQVRYLQLPHRQGVSAARNAGIRASTGEYISFLDADDAWLPRKLRVQVPLLVTHPEVGVVYSHGIRRRAGKDRLFPDASRAPSGDVFEAMLMYHSAVHGGCLLIRRDAFDSAGYFDEDLLTAEDLDLSLRLAFHVKFLFVPEPVMIYNISPHGLWLTSAAHGGASSDHGRAIEKAMRLLPDSPRYRRLREEAPIRIALHAMLPFILIGELTGARAALLEALRAYPSSGRYPWARDEVRRVARQLLRHGASPVAEARLLCAQIEGVTRGGGIRGRWYIRWILADIWADIVLSGALRRRVRFREASFAGIRAIAYAPTRPALVVRIGRTLMREFRQRFRSLV